MKRFFLTFIFTLIFSTPHVHATANKSSGRLQYPLSIENKSPYSFTLHEYDENGNLITSHFIKPHTIDGVSFFKKCRRVELTIENSTYSVSMPFDIHHKTLTVIQDPHLKMITH